MNTKVNSILKEKAKAKLDRLHKSPKYRSFFNDAAIHAFSKVEASAFAGKSIKASPRDDFALRCGFEQFPEKTELCPMLAS